jgi:hypothetical protein
VAESSARESKATGRSPNFERGALEALPSYRSSDSHPKVVASHLVGRKPLHAQASDAIRRRAIDDLQVTEAISAVTGSPKRSFNLVDTNRALPSRLVTTRVVSLRWRRVIHGTWPNG